MSQLNNKLFAYIGFSIKAGKILFGVDAILLKKTPKIIVCDKSLADNSLKKIRNYAENNKVDMYFVENGDLNEYCGGRKCKCIALTDENLSSATRIELKKLSEVDD